MIDAATVIEVEKKLALARELLQEVNNIRRDLMTYNHVFTEIVETPANKITLKIDEFHRYQLNARLSL